MKVVYDTNIYIHFLRSSRYADLLSDRHHIRYLSSAVIMELLAGARTPLQRRQLEKLFSPYSKSLRLIAPTPSNYFKAGEILSKIRMSHGRSLLGLSHDILIAMDAAVIGATLFTNNRDDFQLLKKYIPLKVEFV